MISLLIIDNYDSFTYNLVQLVEQAGILQYDLIKNDGLGQLKKHYDKILISPGPGIASEAGDLLPFLTERYRESSFLGICLGYEALVEFFGGTHQKLPKPLHGYRNKAFVLKEHYLFEKLPRSFFIGHYHSWFTVEETFPDEMELLIKDELGLIMAAAHRQFDLTGLQFHPESIMTEYGAEMIKNWLYH